MLEMNSPFKAIIFDFDYTLADPSPGVAACTNFALNGLGLPAPPAEKLREVIGLSLFDTLRHLAGAAHEERYDDFFELFLQRADQVMVDSTELFSPVRPTIQRLKKQGLGLGIVSMKFRYHIEPILEREGLLASFDIIVGGDDVSKRKPDPEGIKLAMATLNSTPANSLYIGDSVNDAETARRAGLPFAAVLSGAATPEAFHGYDLYRVLDDLSSLPEALNASQSKR